MEPLDLSARPPRPPRQQLDGLTFLPRTIDKLRASLSGGNLGEYQIRGFTASLLQTLGVDEEAIRGAVAAAQSDEDVARWLREHADVSKYGEWNATIEASAVNDENRERLQKRYPVLLRNPHVTSLLDMLELDDREAFAPAT
ncbi:MAG TPA: DUF5069 domain-containing protein [Candidatus Dormibacteraeota bacterium]|nr:DUF5069 domain-containing protein [Candidatus Dormibacteraeota bacterium]